ncbi:MAG: hypothetical protein OEW78_02625 [Nitrosopumilus sp.]|uniref:hypothetical protein n=1 Tax=Nitrosopumilus sp. TaxID=2024843 RepID=UPI0024729A93|nr:hypothetical protein [Nitrosopumilus sp.]MDH5430760.1 hypothetical protein [Nitrosopumilus sp.]MDH5664847.1 hypothetical protein [Nitrosopumilus sp.]MDH5696948.1 hypothetical protein [Nitrosopumilus sp.]
MKISPFKIGLILIIIGIVWTVIIFDETGKKYDAVVLKESSSFQTKQEFSGIGIGYFKLYMPEFSGEEVFVQILDTKDNVIQEQMVQTKMSVGYFDFNEDGKYTMKITNIGKNPINLKTEFGNTNSQKMFASGIMIFVGAIIIMIVSYVKIKNYSIEQPEENIS